ncbi:MAG: hypothetical protein ACKOCO_15145, partial [Bacteroidota bacterium]
MNDKTTNNILTDIWDKYNQVRVTGDKKSANKLLEDYIDLLKQQDEKDITTFVDNICSLTLDANPKIIANNGNEVSDKGTRIQHPLFKQYLQQCDTKNTWEELLTGWELIAKHWSLYLK